MTHVLFWILISIVIGMLSGLVAMIFGNHKVIKRQDGDAEKTLTIWRARKRETWC